MKTAINYFKDSMAHFDHFSGGKKSLANILFAIA